MDDEETNYIPAMIFLTVVTFMCGYALAAIVVDDSQTLKRAAEHGRAVYDTDAHELVWDDEVTRYICTGGRQ